MNILQSLFGIGLPSITAAEAGVRLKSIPTPLFIDVRTPAEFQQIHAVGAKLLPLDQLIKKIGAFPKNKEILVICASGNRSRSATTYLLQHGYKAVNIKGGIRAWVRAGLPTEK